MTSSYLHILHSANRAPGGYSTPSSKQSVAPMWKTQCSFVILCWLGHAAGACLASQSAFPSRASPPSQHLPRPLLPLRQRHHWRLYNLLQAVSAAEGPPGCQKPFTSLTGCVTLDLKNGVPSSELSFVVTKYHLGLPSRRGFDL